MSSVRLFIAPIKPLETTHKMIKIRQKLLIIVVHLCKEILYVIKRLKISGFPITLSIN